MMMGNEYVQATLLDCITGKLLERVKKNASLAVVQPPPAESEPESWLLVCRCRSFDVAHHPDRHKQLASESDWRTESERQ